VLRTAHLIAMGLRLDAGALVAVGAVGAAILGPLIGPAASLLVALVLFGAGVLHGAGEENEGSIRPFSIIHAALYLAVAAAVAALYLASPTTGLVAFLAISVWHFATSHCGFDPVAQGAIAACAIGGSALFHASQTAQVFASITGDAIPAVLMSALCVVGVAGVVAAGYAAVRERRGGGHAILAVMAVMLAAPVLAVALIFFVAHALPVQRAQVARYGPADVLRATLPTGLLALSGIAALGVLVWSGTVALPLAVAIAFGLATPHMLIDGL